MDFFTTLRRAFFRVHDQSWRRKWNDDQRTRNSSEQHIKVDSSDINCGKNATSLKIIKNGTCHWHHEDDSSNISYRIKIPHRSKSSKTRRTIGTFKTKVPILTVVQKWHIARTTIDTFRTKVSISNVVQKWHIAHNYQQRYPPLIEVIIYFENIEIFSNRWSWSMQKESYFFLLYWYGRTRIRSYLIFTVEIWWSLVRSRSVREVDLPQWGVTLWVEYLIFTSGIVQGLQSRNGFSMSLNEIPIIQRKFLQNVIMNCCICKTRDVFIFPFCSYETSSGLGIFHCEAHPLYLGLHLNTSSGDLVTSDIYE